MDEPMGIPIRLPARQVSVLFDPLDGSSNIDVNVSIGTFFRCLRSRPAKKTPAKLLSCSKARARCAPATRSTDRDATGPVGGHGVQVFTIDRDTGSFLLTQPNVTDSSRQREFAVNCPTQALGLHPSARYVDDLLAGSTGPRGVAFNMAGLLNVADVHRIMTRVAF